MKCLIIYNPKSGKQNVVRRIDYIVSVLKQRFEVVDKKASFYDGETRDLARDACGRYDALVVAGGDGTLHEAICGIAPCENKPRLGIIPAGTINDVSRSLKIPRGIDSCLRVILNGKTICHDLFKINNDYGIYASAMGLLTDISYKVNSAPKKKFGKLAYYFSIPKFMFGHNTFDIELETESGNIKEKCSLFLVLNSRSVAGRKVDKKNDMTDGKVELVVFSSKKEKVKLSDIVKIVQFFAFGIRKKTKNYKIIPTSKFNVRLDSPKSLNVDGEKVKSDTYNFEVISPGVEIFC